MATNIIRFPARRSRQATVIFLHGMGQRIDAWHSTMEWLTRQLPNIEWILPQAESKPVTYSQGQLRPSWFNIATLPPGYTEWDEFGVSRSVNLVESIIQAEIHGGMDSRKIVLMGFSQGAALGLMVALTSLHELGGVASLSGWIPHNAREHIIHSEPSLPIFWGYGRSDTEIPPYHSEESMGFLRDVMRLPMSLLTYRRYDGLAHTVNGPELIDLVAWLLRVLGLQPVVDGGIQD